MASSVTQRPGRDEVRPLGLRHGARVVGAVEHLPPGEVLRIAEAEERERRLGEHGDRDVEHGVGEHERQDAGQDVAQP